MVNFALRSILKIAWTDSMAATIRVTNGFHQFFALDLLSASC